MLLSILFIYFLESSFLYILLMPLISFAAPFMPETKSLSAFFFVTVINVLTFVPTAAHISILAVIKDAVA